MQHFLDILYNALCRILPKKAAHTLQVFFSVEFVTFIVVGTVNTLSTAVISTALDFITENISALSSCEIISKLRLTFIAGYILSLLISFILNCRFTFCEKPTLSKLIRFPVSYIPNFIIQYVVVWFFTAVIPIHPTIAYLIAAAIGIPVTFITMRLIVFKRK